jgi:formamidopyrimidine-DNA glycosylase
MPEGPEVQTVVNGLNRSVVGKTIQRCDILDTAKLPEAIPADLFAQSIQDQPIVAAQRRGKYITLELDSGDFIVIHLMMTGHLALIDPDDEAYPRFTRLVFHFTDGSALCFADLRRFGVVTLLRADQMAGYKGFQKLGVDIYADNFTLEAFAPIFTSKRKVHTFLLDQSRISGLGNIYVSESLFRAGIHPLRRADTLTGDEIGKLYVAVRDVTREALDHMGTTFYSFRQADGSRGNFQAFLRVFRKEGEPCPQCGAPIERVKIGNRSAFYCPNEQQL